MNAGGALASLTVTLNQPPTPGNVLIVCHDTSSSRNSIVTGGGVLVWTLCETSIPEKTNSQIWAGVVGPSPATEITIRLGSAPNWASGHVAEWSGVATPLVFEGMSTFGPGGTEATVNVISGTVSGDISDLVVATVGVHGSGQSISLPTHGFTDMMRPASLSGTTMASAYLIPTAAGTFSTTWTLGYRRAWATAIVRFRGVNSGGEPPGPGPGPGPGVPALVQQATAAAGGIAVLPLTMSQLPTPGNVLVVCHDSTSGSNSRFSGGGVSNWVLVQSSLPTQDNSEIWAGVVDTTPNATISIRLGGQPNSAHATVTEWSGLAVPLQFEAVTTSSIVKTRPAVSGTVQADAADVVIATVGVHASTMVIGLPSNGFIDLVRTSSGASSVMASCYKIATAAGPCSTQWDLSFAHRWATAIAVFRAQ